VGLLAWDCYLDEGGVLGDVRKSMVEAAECANILEVQEMNFLMQGKTRSASGKIFGYRFVLECEEGTEEELAETLSKANIEGTSEAGHVWAMRSLAYMQDDALLLSDARSIPTIGTITISVRVSDGWGAIGEKKFNSIRNNQVKDTKNVLNLCSTQYNSSPNNSFLNDALVGALTERGWFLVKRLNDEGSGLTRRAIGGSYQFGYNLEKILDVLVDESEGVWWNSLEDGASRIEVICGGDLGIEQDPKGWFHNREEFRKKIDSGWNEVEWAETKTGCSSAVGYELRRSGSQTKVVDIHYVCDRLASTQRPVESLTIEDGLVEGQERHLVRELVLRPWITREFFHLIQAFLMTRNTRDWLNGSGEIKLLTGRLQ
jgi:hypothetical protein